MEKEVNHVIQEYEILPPDLRRYLYSLFEEYVDDMLAKLRGTHMKETIATTDLQLVVSLCNLLEAFISEKFGYS
jgi:dynein heavy chain